MKKIKIKHKHPLAIRWFHWINFPLLAIMIWSGILIYWAYGIYHIKVGSLTVFKFFPNSFYKALGIPYHLADGMALHFTFMWFFAVNGLLYVLYLAFSGAWRQLLPEKKSWKDAWQVTLYDLHLSKYKPEQGKYNGAQRVAYTVIIIMAFLMLLTGLSIYKPFQLYWLTFLFGGYEMARLIHFTITILLILFFLLHVFQVIRAGWNNFQSMVTGFELMGKSYTEKEAIDDKNEHNPESPYIIDDHLTKDNNENIT